MAEQNLILYIKNEDGTSFHDLRLNKFAYTTTVMSLNSKIEGDFYYKDNTLSFTLAEYVEYKGMKYTLKNPPVIVKKGMTSDNSELKGMTKYTCTFYHEETELYNIPFTDVAVDSQEVSYRGEKRTFSWIGTITSFVAKVDQCLKGTKWRASLQPDFKDDGTLSDVLSFSNQFISDACKTAYETFKIPFVIDGYKILFGKPSNEILDKDGQPYIFQLGQGLGLKNNDVTPKNNKVITRIAGTGSEQNIPYGYPIIKNDAGEVIDHPYTRDHLMPTIYIQTLRHKLLVDSSTPLVDYYDADNTYPTPLNPLSPVFHIQDFEDIRPSIEGMTYLNNEIDTFKDVPTPEGGWDDYINPETGDVRQSYFDVTLYPLGFDLYAQAAVTSAMSFSMKSGNTLGANFEVAVDWEEVKKNFYVTDDNGNVIFKPDGDQRDLTKFPDSTSSPITITLTKDLETFGTLMPNQWQYPVAGDKFVILGIEMPQEYIDAAQDRLDAAMKKYMLENNMPLYDYPLEFDEFFLTNNIDILDQIKENAIIRFKYGNEAMALSVKEISVRYGYDKLPKYSITLTDDVSIVLNQIGQIADGLSKLGSQVAALQAVYGMDIYAELNRKLSRVKDDTSTGKITSTKGFQVGNFVTGSTGGIFNVDTLGKSHMELDYLTVRMKAFFYALEVIKTGVIGGRLMVTPGGAIECTKVEEFDTYYRCYFLANDGETKIENRFRQGDQALSEDFNVQAGVYEGVSNHYYWRLVVGTGENYIDLSKTDADTSKEFKSDIPKAGDTICQLGNRTDQTRQNALIMSAADTYSPSLTFYCGINNYSYLDKEYIEYGVDKTTNLAYMNVYGNSYIGARDRSTYIKYDTDTGVEIKGTLVTKSGRDVDQAFNSFQDQIDGVKETWYGEYSPNLTNYPASDWTTENLKKRHEGDVFTNIQPFISDETTPDAGKSWRWVQSNDTWGWTQIADSDTSKAYYEAAKAAKAAEEARKQVNEVNSTVNSMRDFTDDAFKDGVVGRSEAVTIQGYLNNISSIEKDITESYNKVYTNPLLESVPKTDLYDAYTGLKTSITELVATINNAIADGITTSVEVAEVDGRYNTFNTKYGDFIGYLNAANKAIQDNINNTALNAKKAAEESYLEAIAAQERLDEWADDGVISPTEKQGLKDEIARIDADKENIGTNFNLYSLGSPDTYNKAHADYRASLVSLSSPTPEIISIPSDFQGLQSTYYNQRTAALNTIAKATKDLLGDIGTDMNSYEYLKRAWGENTTVEGGLLFSSLAQFGSTTNNVFTVKSGINGISIDSRPGGGIASWYGGAMKDRADYTDDTMPSDVAKAVIRMDGSGYLANGAVWWGLDGKFHADPASFIINEDQIGDYLKLFQIIYKKPDKKDINYIVPQYPMQSLQIASYVEIGSTGYRIGVNPTTGLLRIYNLNGNTNFGVEIDGDLLVSGGVTAYTQGSRTASTILDGLAIDPNTLSKEGGILSVIGGAGGGGSVDGVILNGTTYSPNEDTKLITLPNYPTTLPASDVYAWAKASTKPAYSWSEITSKPSWIGSTKPSYAFSEITGKPTTLSGYGITDGVNAVSVSGSGNAVTSATVSGHSLTLTKGTTFLTSHQSLANYVTLNTAQTITGKKSFSGDMYVSNVLQVNKRLHVGATLLGVYDANRSEISIVSAGAHAGELWLGSEGARFHSISARTAAEGRGLLLFDGVNGRNIFEYKPSDTYIRFYTATTKGAEIISSTGAGTYLMLTYRGGTTGEVGNYNTLGTYMQYNVTGYPAICVNSADINAPKFNFSGTYHNLLHSGNYSSFLDVRYRPMQGSWAGSGVPGTRNFGFVTDNVQGEVAFLQNGNTMNMVIDGDIYCRDASYLVWHDGDTSRNTAQIFQQGYKWLDLTGYDSNKWYPCSTNLNSPSSSAQPNRIVLYNALDGQSHPSWATHPNGFTQIIDMETWPGGWGTTNVRAYLNAHDALFGGETAFGGVEQNHMNSTLIIWLRGGAKYKYWTNYYGDIYANTTYSWSSGNYSFSRTAQTSQNAPIGGFLKGFSAARFHSDYRADNAFFITTAGNDIGIRNNNAYLEIQSKDELIVSGGSTMYVNYRRGINAATPATWKWLAGSSSSWANMEMGNVIAYNIHPRGDNQYSLGSLSTSWGQIFSKGWFRSVNATGWHNETYGGGIWMRNYTYVEVYGKDWFRSNMFSAGNAQDDQYSIAYNACATSGSNWCCYSMIRSGTYAFGMGFNTSNEIWLGVPNSPNRLAYAMWLRIGSGQMTYAGNFLATGGVTAYSQRSLKDVIGEADISLERLATIKPFYFTWKDKRDDRMHLGGIAEDVQELFPEVIYKTTDNILAMDYGNAAFAISAVLAQHTLRHESEIEQLKRENRELRGRIEELERKE